LWIFYFLFFIFLTHFYIIGPMWQCPSTIRSVFIKKIKNSRIDVARPVVRVYESGM